VSLTGMIRSNTTGYAMRYLPPHHQYNMFDQRTFKNGAGIQQPAPVKPETCGITANYMDDTLSCYNSTSLILNNQLRLSLRQKPMR